MPLEALAVALPLDNAQASEVDVTLDVNAPAVVMEVVAVVLHPPAPVTVTE